MVSDVSDFCICLSILCFGWPEDSAETINQTMHMWSWNLLESHTCFFPRLWAYLGLKIGYRWRKLRRQQKRKGLWHQWHFWAGLGVTIHRQNRTISAKEFSATRITKVRVSGCRDSTHHSGCFYQISLIHFAHMTHPNKNRWFRTQDNQKLPQFSCLVPGWILFFTVARKRWSSAVRGLSDSDLPSPVFPFTVGILTLPSSTTRGSGNHILANCNDVFVIDQRRFGISIWESIDLMIPFEVIFPDMGVSFTT